MEKIAALRARFAADAYCGFKYDEMPKSTVCGMEFVLRPYCGGWVPMLPDVSAGFHHVVIRETLRKVMGDADVVVDLGCGNGHVIGELQKLDGNRQYRAVDADEDGVGCAQELGVDARLMRFEDPDFSWLRGFRKPFFYSIAALTYAKPFHPDFWSRLRSVTPDFSAFLLEMISYRVTPNPLFTEERARQYQLSESFFDETQRAARSGTIVIEKIFPDYIGVSAFSAVSIVKVRSP